MVKVLALRDDGSFAPVELDELYLKIGTGGPLPDPLEPDLPTDPDVPTVPTDSPFVPAGYARTFSDQFDSPLLQIVDAEQAKGGEHWIASWKRWNIRHLESNNDKGMKVLIPGQTHVQSERGLILRGLNQPATAQSGGKVITLLFTAAMISTELSFAQRFGYFEVKASMRLSKGMHMAMWLLHKDGSYARDKEVCEVDLVEAINAEKKVYFNHIGPGTEEQNNVAADPAQPHVYGLLWEPDRMTWFLDGKKVRESRKVMPREAYFLASLEIGGNWPGMPDGSTRWPAEVEISYVRSYSKSA